MFRQNPILIVEDEPLIAMDLAAEITALDGRVIGPAPTVAEALVILMREPIAAAILDAHLADSDITPVALLLNQRRVPFVIHSSIGIPERLAQALPALPLIRKPAPPAKVIERLLATMAGE